jgi:hypothetical protein
MAGPLTGAMGRGADNQATMHASEGQILLAARLTGSPGAQSLTSARLRSILRWLQRVAPYVLLGILVPGGGLAALMLWVSRQGGSFGLVLARTLRTTLMLAVALALPSSL